MREGCKNPGIIIIQNSVSWKIFRKAINCINRYLGDMTSLRCTLSFILSCRKISRDRVEIVYNKITSVMRLEASHMYTIVRLIATLRTYFKNKTNPFATMRFWKQRSSSYYSPALPYKFFRF